MRTLLAAIVAGTVAAPAFGQGLSIPPRQDARSPTGVSYGSGAFSYEARDLSIGGESPEGLTFDRSYLSNLDYGALGAHGWVHNWAGRVISQMVAAPLGDLGSPIWTDPQRGPWVYNVTVGGRSVGFRGGSHFPPTTGGPVGSYEPITPSGATLVYTGTDSTNGRYIFTDSDGSVINFPLGSQPLTMEDLTMPDGTRLDFTWSGLTLRSVISNRGYAILVDVLPSGQWKVCAVNMSHHAITAASACPAGAQSVTYSFGNGSFNPSLKLMTGATDANGQTTSYSYVGPDRLGCITLPGQAVCQVQNVYTLCYEIDPATNQLVYRTEYVTAQSSATGETYGYAYQFDFGDPTRCRGVTSAETTMTMNGTAVTRAAGMNSAGLPGSAVDPLNRTTSFAYNTGGALEDEPAQIADIHHPLGNGVSYEYDSRGNIERELRIAVPGSGLATIERSAVYPATCVDRNTCNKPISVTDARSNTTAYTYDPAHGGVLTETGPAVSGVAPQTRHEYAQRYAWILAPGGGSYVQAATPVWLRTATSFCRISAATGNAASPCATAGDEVRTAYGYGPDSGPNTLLLRGQAVTSTDGGVTTTLRTCYGYDRDGRRISETQPNANLASCP